MNLKKIVFKNEDDLSSEEKEFLENILDSCVYEHNCLNVETGSVYPVFNNTELAENEIKLLAKVGWDSYKDQAIEQIYEDMTVEVLKKDFYMNINTEEIRKYPDTSDFDIAFRIGKKLYYTSFLGKCQSEFNPDKEIYYQEIYCYERVANNYGTLEWIPNAEFRLDVGEASEKGVIDAVTEFGVEFYNYENDDSVNEDYADEIDELTFTCFFNDLFQNISAKQNFIVEKELANS